MILIGRGLNHEAGVSGERVEHTGSERSSEAEDAEKSVQVNSNCAVVKVRIKDSVRQKRNRKP